MNTLGVSDSTGPVGSAAFVHAADAPAAVPSGTGPGQASAEVRRFIADVVAEYGPTVRRTASGRKELNHASMARILARRLGLAWDGSSRQFLLWRDQYVPIPTERATSLVTDALQRIAALQSDTFPMRELRPRRIARLMDAIRVSSPWYGPGLQDGLHRFVEKCLVLKPGESVTTTELYSAYGRYAHAHRLPVYPRAAFGRELDRAVFKVYLKTPSNSVLRPNSGKSRLTSRHGFKGMGFADDIPAGEAGDAGDARLAIADSGKPT